MYENELHPTIDLAASLAIVFTDHLYQLNIYFVKKEWLHALSCIQEEEKDRVMKFVYKKDAKSALVRIQCYAQVKA